jgi:hypothetical protein
MIEVDALCVVDAYEWLGKGDAAGRFLNVSQPTVSRENKRFRVLRKQLDELDCLDLVFMERIIHQRLRFQQGRNLRLHAFQWLNHLIAKQPLPQWKVNPADISVTKRSVIDLLEERIIDAACAPYPLIATLSKDTFAFLPLYCSCLQIMTNTASVITQEKGLHAGDIAYLTLLGSLSFVPEEAAKCSKQLDAMQFGNTKDGKSKDSIPFRYWGTPLTPLVAPHLSAIDYGTKIPYEEYLVVHKDWAGHAHVSELQRTIINAMQSAIRKQEISGLIDFAKQ